MDSSNINMNRCCNCGKNGHLYKQCDKAITSYGIIAYKIIDDKIKEKEPFTKNVEKMLNKIKIMNFYKPKYEDKRIKFLMIQRKQTMAYVDLLRGKYNESNKEQINILLNEMTISEIKRLRNKVFDDLWDELWINHNCASYNKEYEYAKKKFNKFQKEKFLTGIKTRYIHSEWGFPKGRKQYYETPEQCAKREFEEETGYKKILLDIDKTKLYKEEFTGTNNIDYIHEYYLVKMDSDISKPYVNKNNKVQYGEVKNIGWFSYTECLELMRPYDIEKQKILKQVYQDIVKTLKV